MDSLNLHKKHSPPKKLKCDIDVVFVQTSAHFKLGDVALVKTDNIVHLPMRVGRFPANRDSADTKRQLISVLSKRLDKNLRCPEFPSRGIVSCLEMCARAHKNVQPVGHITDNVHPGAQKIARQIRRAHKGI